MRQNEEKISDAAARAIWLRAAQLQAEAEQRMEERGRMLQSGADRGPGRGGGLRPDDIRAAAVEVGISPEFVQIAIAEHAAGGMHEAPLARWEARVARRFLGAGRSGIEIARTIPGTLDAVTQAVMRVFPGHPCLLQPGEVADLPSEAGRVIVFNVPRYDWGATANLPFVEKAYMVGLRQIQVTVRQLPGAPATCEVLVLGDLNPGMRSRWRFGAGTSIGGGVLGGGVAASMAASSTVASILLAVPAAALGAAAIGGGVAAIWGLSYRYYQKQVEAALMESVGMLYASARAMAWGNEGGGGIGPSPGSMALPPF